MLKVRVIPSLLLADGGLVKTEKFRNAKYLGDPINTVKIFNEKEVDELIFIDIQCSQQKKKPSLEVIKDLASECFMPLSYGGGIDSLVQIEQILKIGVEKVVINHHALYHPAFLSSASQNFAQSTIVGAMDIKKNLWGNYMVYDHVKKKTLDISPVEYAKRLESLGCGELFINNVDREGTYLGFDLKIIEMITAAVGIPVTVCGGASKLTDITLAAEAGASAVAIGSLFVYQGPHRAVLISYPSFNKLKELLSHA
ncbi:AglZ/HisF2 family acetamidino modification protein [Chitinophaga sp. 22321]|uniref:imidazole glycerol-phosphate synthase n=1 Tax=Chitinophaga hostae TaxID=2831022 RepID=A0ABS5J0H9_9BACT|nr:AglZ/HisF2 family acetamidino modification protein [Chitinophaga hostae]MBS0028551.1 AglZ/HisF2 family acetamidino modification protein [Chitinophaga hostae]